MRALKHLVIAFVVALPLGLIYEFVLDGPFPALFAIGILMAIWILLVAIADLRSELRSDHGDRERQR